MFAGLPYLMALFSPPFKVEKISVCRNIRKDVYEKDIDPYRSMSLESYNICYKMHYEACS